MEEAVGEPVGLGMGFQAGGLIGLYLGFSLATISVLTDAENIQRTVSLMCIPPFLFSLILGPFLARRKKPVILTKEPLKEARENFEKEYLISQIKKFGGNISKTAKFVGMERSALHRKLKILGVKDLN